MKLTLKVLIVHAHAGERPVKKRPTEAVAGEACSVARESAAGKARRLRRGELTPARLEKYLRIDGGDVRRLGRQIERTIDQGDL